MPEVVLDERFSKPELDPRLIWFNPPPQWSVTTSALVIETGANTDYWQKTHYGFQADNGHFLFMSVEGDFILTTQVRFRPMVHQYDQAGLMVRLSAQCWLKTSVEYELDGPPKLGVVVTNHGFSDWSTQDFLVDDREISLRVRREGSDYVVAYAQVAEKNPAAGWTQIRLAHLHEDSKGPVQAGLYACSPKEAGYKPEFYFLKIETG